MTKEEFTAKFGRDLDCSCQRMMCMDNEGGKCTKKDIYPCERVLPDYMLTILEKRWERYRKAHQLSDDRLQMRLNFGGGHESP